MRVPVSRRSRNHSSHCLTASVVELMRRRREKELDVLEIRISRWPQRMPARMKLCTNWRWKSRKARSRGSVVISVAAVMIDQSMP